MNTIAAISTPLAPGGLGVIRVSGDDAVVIADKVFRSKGGQKLAQKSGYTALYGTVFDENGDIDDCVALVFLAPHSYTGENVVELSLHGGNYVLTRALSALISQGAQIASGGEFTKRAFLNGKMSLTAAESVMDTINAQGRQAQRMALLMREGALFKEIEEIKNDLILAESHVAAYIDFPEEGVDEITTDELLEIVSRSYKKVSALCSNFEKGKIIREGVNTAIVGKPNVGKSTLMNRLSGFEKSIVTDIAGTTRDVVEETVRVGDVVLRLCDTAGIHETNDKVEKIGVDKALDNISTADLVLAVFDHSQELNDDDKNLILKVKDKLTLAIINKTDLDKKCDVEFIKDNLKNVVSLSIEKDESIEELEQAISKLLNIENIDQTGAVLSNLRQLECATTAKNHLFDAKTTIESGFTLDMAGVCIQSAIASLCELTGENVSESVIEKVFENFCVGK